MSRAHPLRRIWLALLLLVAGCALLSRAAAFPDWTDCPAVCSCRWTHGKKSALCPGAGLTSLPAGLDPEMQVLDLSGNRIPDLKAEVFKDFGLLNLQRVFLRNSGIRSVHAESFKDMRILVEVDLSDNHLTSLDPKTFTGNERLKQLVLNGNPLGILRANQFPRLQHLRNLELQRCQLTQVHHLAFQWLSNLETLSLDNNKLEYLDGEAMVRLKQLKTLSLDNNPWSCDCRLRDFRQLLVPGGEMDGLYSVPQICHSPARNQGRRWEELGVSEFACEPTVYLPVSNIQEEVNGNVSLACLASGDPEPEVWWWLNGGPINGSRKPPDEGPPGSVVVYSTSLETRRRLVQRWNNLTIYNASDAYAGEYTCHARNVAGMVRDTVAVSIPQVFTAPTLSQADNWLLWLSLAGGGAVALSVSATAVLIAVCLCGSARRRSRRAKVKLQASASFGDQEKKLLDLSVTTTATTTSQQHSHHHPNQNHNHSASPAAVPLHADLNHCQPEFELELEPCLVQERLISTASCGPSSASVTVEQLRLGPRDSPRQLVQLPPSQAPVLCPVAVATASRCLSPGLPANIFIAVSLPSGQDSPGAPVPAAARCYPDLLDVGMSSFATLPRRSNPIRGGSRELGSPYDNMGPRVTATGSSTFSLAEQPDALSLAAAAVPLIQPPPEFVSL